MPKPYSTIRTRHSIRRALSGSTFWGRARQCPTPKTEQEGRRKRVARGSRLTGLEYKIEMKAKPDWLIASAWWAYLITAVILYGYLHVAWANTLDLLLGFSVLVAFSVWYVIHRFRYRDPSRPAGWLVRMGIYAGREAQRCQPGNLPKGENGKWRTKVTPPKLSGWTRLARRTLSITPSPSTPRARNNGIDLGHAESGSPAPEDSK